MPEMTLDQLLRQFEKIDANLKKIDVNLRRLDEIESATTSTGYSFDDCAGAVYDIWNALPPIDGWKPDIEIYDPNQKTLMRFDAQEVGEPHAFFAVEEEFEQAEATIKDYKRRARQKRLDVTRARILELSEQADQAVSVLKSKIKAGASDFFAEHEPISEAVKEIDALLGSAFQRPPRWSDLRRHLSFWEECDVHDIVNHDWPSVYPVLTEQLYTEDEPIKLDIGDLGTITVSAGNKPVTTQLNWDRLDEENFERLIFNLIVEEPGYHDPKWLMRGNAPDRGRDLSVDRAYEDSLSGVIRSRIIIQCKHWRTKSVSIGDISSLKEQIKLWEPPTVDVVIITTSGRFTADAVAWIEKHNQSGQSPRIDMWPESHLEMLLVRRPGLIASFHLKD